MPDLINPYFAFVSWQPHAILACKCMTPKTVIITLYGLHKQERCQFCRTGYSIAGVNSDGTLAFDVNPPGALPATEM